MDYLNIEADKLKGIGALDTAKEISGQPELWVDVFHKLMLERKEISEFLKSTLYKTKKIILTGAGTSAYIGFSVEGAMQRNTGINTYSVATTHLVTHPQDYFEKDTPTLLISFARSGNSPESVAAAKFADKYCLNCYHLIITCNKDGDLARFSSKNKNLVFLLPPNSNDKSLAMTGSYTGMLLAAILLSDFDNLDTKESTINTLVEYSKVLLYQRLKDVKNIASIPFKRAVFLGSGPLYGTAMESHLKLQELTDGFVICKNDSYLGFRHGPKAVVDEDTLIVYFFSN
jgi:tagatose-6-phosphate ketose/aldose isomerase